MSGKDIIYRIDGQDRIVFVNEEWDRFAQANDGESVLSARILQRPLWDFISDMTTQELYRQILQRVRSGRPIRFTFRCDAPHFRRTLQMDIHLVEGDTVELRTQTLAEERRQPIQFETLQDRVPGDLLRMCSWCKKVHVEGAWEELEVAVERLQLFQRPRPPLITHSVCESCYHTMLDMLAQG